MLQQTDLARVDLNLLVLFDIVLKHRHVGRAARELHLSASAVSHGLRRLRTLFGDPLFRKTPKGVTPTARALELADPVADVLARARRIVAADAKFDPSTSTRRFVIGAPDGVSTVFTPPLAAHVRTAAPRVDIGVRELLPSSAVRDRTRIWQYAFDELDAGAADVAVLPLSDAPARFIVRPLYEEDFVIAVRARGAYARRPGLDLFCATPQLVVSAAADPYGFVDEALAAMGRTRRVALTAPNFMFAMAVLATTDLIAAMPRGLLAQHARRFGLVSVDAPLALPRFAMSAVAPRAGMQDGGVAWLLGVLQQVTSTLDGRRRARRR